RAGAARPGRRGAVRHHGELADLESHRGHGRRPAHHRRHQRQPHHAHGHPHADLGRGPDGLLRRAALDAAGDPVLGGTLRRGPLAVTGSLVQWFRDRLGLIHSAPEIETLARTVEDNGGCYIVPAFSGLFAPHWRSDARGVIVGLTSYITKGHLARAVLEATGW